MTERGNNPSTKDLQNSVTGLEKLLDTAIKRIHELDYQVGKLLNCIETAYRRLDELELQRIADYYNVRIDKKLDEYENKNKPKT